MLVGGGEESSSSTGHYAGDMAMAMLLSTSRYDFDWLTRDLRHSPRRGGWKRSASSARARCSLLHQM